MNEVEIVVTSEDRTHVGAIGEKFKKELSRSVNSSMKEVDKTVSNGFKNAGDHAGKELNGALKASVNNVERDVSNGMRRTGEHAAQSYSDALKTGLDKADRVVTFKVKESIGGWNRTVTHRMREVGHD